MKLSKKNWVLLGLVALLCVTGYLNLKFNQTASQTPEVAVEQTQSNDSAQTNASALTYYTQYRTERTQTRNKEVEWLNAIIADEKADAASIKEANEKKLKIIDVMEKETATENLIKAKGYSECIVSIGDGSVSIVVENKEALTSAEAAQIMSIAQEQTGQKAANIKIMPRN